jgi:hypothetical protein
MNFFTTQHFFRTTRRWLALLAAILAVGGGRADAQSGRFLLIFETSPALKKNLPSIGQTLDKLFSSNLQNEMRENDDLAVWTVDQSLHTGTFPLEGWTPAEAAAYSARLKNFLARQNFSRYANLAAVQPLLDRVMKSSERLTVLIFCDSQSRLLGTPYDAGVNEIITNAAARAKIIQPFILVLRSYQGEYLGCSVNRSATLNFPKFPPPPKPEAAPPPEPPVVKPPPVVAPAVVAAPVPALIIVGTNAGTNLSALSPPPAPVPETNSPATNPPPPAPKMVVALATNPPPPIMPLPLPAPVVEKTSAPEPVVVAPVIASNPPVAPPAKAVAVAPENNPVASDAGILEPLLIGGGALAVAAGLVIWLVVRARRPRGSLITSSMHNDPRLPPRK